VSLRQIYEPRSTPIAMKLLFYKYVMCKIINDGWVYDCKRIGRYLRPVEAHICCVLLPPDGAEC
jgi:hypothetical protein